MPDAPQLTLAPAMTSDPAVSDTPSETQLSDTMTPAAQSLLPDENPSTKIEPETSEFAPFLLTEKSKIAESKDAPSTSETKSTIQEPKKPTVPEKNTAKEADLISKALHFFATASPNALIGTVTGVATATYFIFGRLGLLLIGAVAGIVFYISYDGRTPQETRAIRIETGAELMKRLLKTKEPSKYLKADEALNEEAIISSLDDFPPQTRDALRNLVDATIQDYVKYWYSPIVPSDQSFSLSVRRALTSYILAISNHVARKRPADVFLDFVTNSVSMLIVFLSELSHAFANIPADGNTNATDIVYDYLAENPESNLAHLLNQRQQAVKLKTIAEDMLTYLDRPILECDPVRIFLREIFSSVILEKTLLSCSRPEWINGWIVYMLEAGEPDFNQAIDVGMQTGPDAKKKEQDLKAKEEAKKKEKKEAEKQTKKNESEKTSSPCNSLDVSQKRATRVADEMRKAMKEMRRMNEMIAKEEARRSKSMEEDRPKTASDSNSKTFSVVDGEDSNSSDAIRTPVTPTSPLTESVKSSEAENIESSPINELRPFTSFDQMVPPMSDPLPEEAAASEKAPLTLYNATITVHDDDTDSTWKLLGKPNWEYLVQAEPASSVYPGWMVVRKYSDFESLHEILRRIASVSGAAAFLEQHATLPSWKNNTRSSLRKVLEVYLRDACWFQSLAESEGMKRFLDKDQGMPKVPEKGIFGWNAMGNVLDAVADAPKGAFQGSKAVVGGLFGSIGNLSKRVSQQQTPTPSSQLITPHTPVTAVESQPQNNDTLSPTSQGYSSLTRTSMDSTRSFVISVQPEKIAPMERRPSYQSMSPTPADGSDDCRSHFDRWERISNSGRASREHSRASSVIGLRSPRSPSVASVFAMEGLKLPPKPDEMDEAAENTVFCKTRDRSDTISADNEGARTVLGRTGTFGGEKPAPPSDSSALVPPTVEEKMKTAAEKEIKTEAKKEPRYPPLSESETRVAIELVFAVINELYTLSSAWNIRRTLLTAAKSFLLRPGNPSLLSIQDMMQTAVLDANTSDEGLAGYIAKIRENAMPTPEELAAWPAEMTAEEKETLRVKARALFIKSGVPEALKGVMGEKASADALGCLFDCLQMEEVARGLFFGILLQTVRIITH